MQARFAARLGRHASMRAAPEDAAAGVQLRPRSRAVYCSPRPMAGARARARRGLIARAVLGALLQPALFTLLLFAPAPSFAWWRAWVAVAVVAVATALSVAALVRADPALLEERLAPPIQRAQPPGDRVVVLIVLAAFAGTLLVVPLDVFRWRLLPPPPALVAAAGLGLFVAGWWLIWRALAANTFAAPVVRHQAERGQRVVDRGPYAVVRHPMYAGAALLLVGLSLWLESTAGVVAALVPILALVARAVLEERFLARALPGYAAYAARVRARLVPGVW